MQYLSLLALGSYRHRIREAPDIVWCGALNGLFVIIGVSGLRSPDMLCILVISSDSLRFKSGSIDGRHLAM